MKRIFDLFAYKNMSVEQIVKQLAEEGVCFSPSRPKFSISKVYALLNDRSYLGELKFHDEWFPGIHDPLIDSQTWGRVQELLGNRIYRSHNTLLGDGLIVCGFCGKPITPEGEPWPIRDHRHCRQSV